MTAKKPAMIKWYGKLFYGAGNLAYASVSQTMSSFIMFFGTSILGISGTLMGLAIALSTMWDAVTDPVMGYVSDRKKSYLWGRRHGFIIIGIFGMALFNILLWSVPNSLTTDAKFVWLLVALLIMETFNTFVATPYTALGAELSGDYHERTVIQSYKSVFYLIGLVIPSILMSIFLKDTPAFPNGQLNPAGYLNIAYVTSCICLVCGVICFLGTYSHLPRLRAKAELEAKTSDKLNFKKVISEFFGMFKRKNYRAIILGHAMALISSAFLTSTGMHVFTYTFGFKSAQIATLMAMLILGSIVSQPLWIYISKKTEKKPALIKSLWIVILCMIVLFVIFLLRNYLGQAIFYCMIPLLFMCGVGMGAMYSVSPSMYNDLIAIDYYKTRTEKTATYSSFMTLSYKISNAVALIVIGVLLDVIKFDSANNLNQPESVKISLAVMFIFGIILSILAAIKMFSGYEITKTDLAQIDKDGDGKIDVLEE